MTTHTPAEVFPPSEYLRDELEEREWTVTEFAQIIGRPIQAVSEILNDKKEITAETAIEIGEALGTGPEMWLNLQTNYRLFQLRQQGTDQPMSDIARRARLRNLVPLAEIRRRGWITDADELDTLETDVKQLLGVGSLGTTPSFAMAARRTNVADPVSPAQLAWLGHIRSVATERPTNSYDAAQLVKVASKLPRLLSAGPEAIPSAWSAVESCGVVMVAAEGLRGGKLDGAVTLLPDGRPVVGLTARGDRFDSFVFTWLHECAHLALGHVTTGRASIIDENLAEKSSDPVEIAADEQASTWITPESLNITSASLPAIMAEANRFGVHPSLILGRVQFNSGNWKQHRRLIPKVRPALEQQGLLS